MSPCGCCCWFERPGGSSLSRSNPVHQAATTRSAPPRRKLWRLRLRRKWANASEGAHYVKAGSATADIDVRVSSGSEAHRINEGLDGLTARSQNATQNATVNVTGGWNRPVMPRSNQTAWLFAEAQQVAAQLGFQLAETSAGGASDDNFAAALGLPVLDGSAQSVVARTPGTSGSALTACLSGHASLPVSSPRCRSAPSRGGAAKLPPWLCEEFRNCRQLPALRPTGCRSVGVLRPLRELARQTLSRVLPPPEARFAWARGSICCMDNELVSSCRPTSPG